MLPMQISFSSSHGTALRIRPAPITAVLLVSQSEFDDSDSAMLCSGVPLIASDGTVMGVAGLGKHLCSSNQTTPGQLVSKPHFLYVSAPYGDKCLCMEKAMFAGEATLPVILSVHFPSKFSTVQIDYSDMLVHKQFLLRADLKVRLYAADSPYEQEEWRIVWFLKQT